LALTVPERRAYEARGGFVLVVRGRLRIHAGNSDNT
jgi:hypothetical protein